MTAKCSFLLIFFKKVIIYELERQIAYFVDFFLGFIYNDAMATKRKFKLPPAAMIAISVFSVIAVGTALLCIPAASNSGEVDFLAAFFTATSATCVTGLSAVDTASHWSYFGQAIILVLMQIGGLGLITILSVFFLYLQKHTSLSQRKLVMQSAGFVSLEGMKKLVKYIIIVTFACEFIGSFALCFSFVPVMGWGRGIWQSVFTGVSAFCNCGYTLTGWYGQDSLNAYISDPVVCLTVSALIVIGGIGFFVWGDVIKNGIHLKRYSFHSKVVLTTTAALILVGWAMFMAFEWNNPATIADKDVGTKLLATLFMSISPRTAGFNTVSSKYLSGAGGMLSIVLMFIGGSPGSTAGGIKTTTLAVLVMSAISTSRRRAEAHIFNRRFEDDAYPQAGTVFSIYITAVILSSMIICALECDNPAVANVADGSVNIHYVVFEVVSAIGTVGLSCGITGAVGAASQLILIFLMFLGRVGGFTLILVFTNERKPVTISRVAGNLIIG